MIHKLEKIPIKSTAKQVVDRLRIQELEDIELVTELFRKACDIANPKALYREAYVEEIEGCKVRISGKDFESAVMAANLKNIHRVFAYVCTCGTEIDNWSHLEKDHIVSLWLDMIKQMFVYDANLFLFKHLKTVFGFKNLSAMNPGSGNLGNWPITQQRELFSLIGDVKSEIGVTLTDTFLMLPVKSTSGLYFSSEKEFVNCALCGRKNCVGRKAEFDEKLYNEVFSCL
ncbi:MAG: hypothetical protein LBI03_11900 [Clostridiales bacterium]|jgi:hypothetical protein|nr:hypothetical protein [Clostridiales bacterium]